MIQSVELLAYEIPHIFGNKRRNIKIDLGSIEGGFWGDNISMVSAIVGKNGTGKSSILRYIKNSLAIKRGYNSFSNIIYYSPHLDYIDNYNFDIDHTDISLDNILRRDLEEIIDSEKETGENGWKLNPKQDLNFLNTGRQMDFLSSTFRYENVIFSEILEKLKFGVGTLLLRGTIKAEITNDYFHNTPYQFRKIILNILEQCETEIRKWSNVRRMDNDKVINQHEINAYIFKRNLIISFISIVVALMEKSNNHLSEGVIEIDRSKNATDLFKSFVTNAKVYNHGGSKKDAVAVFNEKVLQLFEFIDELVDGISDEEMISSKSFNTEYENLEKIKTLQKEIINHLALNYYTEKTKVNSFLGIKSTSRNLSSGENALLNFYSVLYEFIQKIDEENIHEEYILLLDEADLGYHPEWKKKFVNSIVKSLPLFFKFSNKQSKIQIIFTTHDPLTLSDIPRQNVVFLDRDAEGFTIISDNSKETFGANIHDLLADSFFISDSLMGDFAKEKIYKTIIWLRFKLLQKEINLFEDVEDPVLEQMEQELNSLLIENRWVVESLKEQHRKIIDLLDEPLLKYKMNEMYYQIFPDEINKEDARRKIIEIARSSGLNIEIRE